MRCIFSAGMEGLPCCCCSSHLHHPSLCRNVTISQPCGAAAGELCLQSCPSAPSYCDCTSLLCLLRWGAQSLPGVPNRCWDDWLQNTALGLFSLTLLGCRASMGLGWGKEKECWWGFLVCHSFKKNPKVITWPCKFNLLWRSFEVAAVSEALEAKLVGSWEDPQLFWASFAGAGWQHRVGCRLCCQDKCSKHSGQGFNWKAAPAHSVSSWSAAWSGYWCSFCLWKGAGEGKASCWEWKDGSKLPRARFWFMCVFLKRLRRRESFFIALSAAFGFQCKSCI